MCVCVCDSEVAAAAPYFLSFFFFGAFGITLLFFFFGFYNILVSLLLPSFFRLSLPSPSSFASCYLPKALAKTLILFTFSLLHTPLHPLSLILSFFDLNSKRHIINIIILVFFLIFVKSSQ